MERSVEEILQLAEEENVEFIRLQFTDLFGNLKNMAVTARELEKALNNEVMFDGAAIDGFCTEEESDMYLYPDRDTWNILPWRPQHGKVARMICDVYTVAKKPFEGDPRRVLKRAIDEAAAMGYTFHVGPECEFFLFRTDEDGRPTTVTEEAEKAGYFDIGPIDAGENARRDMVLTLEDMGFEIRSSHHEMAPAQHEIDFAHDEALNTADNVVTFKMAVKTIARRHGQHATFMPKPREDNNGSGMHLNMSLHRDGVNVFRNDDSPEGISDEARYFMGGLIKHIKGMTAVLNPLVNSYKRLVPGYDAPVGISWSAKSRSSMIRIPADRGARARLELKSPDSAANPYLAFALVLSAGLDGIRNRIEPPAAVDADLGKKNASELMAMGVDSLPANLFEAVAELKADKLLCDTLGPHITALYTEGKIREYTEYSAAVSAWELNRYLYKY